MQGNTLADWLRTRDDAALSALLSLRPDLATPPPAGTAVLATRAGIAASVVRACEDLDAFTLTVLEAMLVLGADAIPVRLTAVRKLLGKTVPAARLNDAIDKLRIRAIVWGADQELRVLPSVRETMPTFPGGLGRSVPRLAEIDLGEVLAELDPQERRVLDALAVGPPIGTTKDAAVDATLAEAVTPIQRLLARGLLVRRDTETVELPYEVGIALRGTRPLGTVQFQEPPLQLTAHQTTAVDRTAAGETLELIRHVETLLRFWSHEEVPVLRSGGIGVRELRKTAQELAVSEQHATLLVELVVGAGLVANSEGPEPEWVPTTLTDSWLSSSTEQRWITLVTAWLALPRLPGLIGLRDDRDRTIGLLTEQVQRPTAPVQRRRILDALAELPAGNGVDLDEFVAMLAWRAPRHGGKLRDQVARWTMAEASALGLIALGAMTSTARILLSDGPVAAAKQLTEALPEPLDHVLVQADLTVVAPGPLEPTLAEDMALVADVESAGSATVYRISETSVRRALDAGRTSTELHELFTTRSRTPVPQSLSYLIDDVARRHGQLRGGAAGSFLRCDDQVLIAEVLANPLAGSLELRRIAPTVLISPLPLSDVLVELRAAGFTPVAEGPDGTLIDLRSAGRRIPAKGRRTRQVSAETISDDQLRDLVGRIRASDDAAKVRPGEGLVSDTSATLALLRAAAAKGQGVWLGFVDSQGVSSQHVVEPVSVGAGMVEGFDRSAGEIRRFPLHLITSAALADE